MFNTLKKYILSKKQKAKIKTKDLAIFFRMLATLINSGIPVIKSFELAEKQQIKMQMQFAIKEIKQKALDGKSLFIAFSNKSYLFENMVCQLIHIGEQTGTLGELLNKIAILYEKKLLFKNKIKKALLYPCIILSLGTMILLTLLIMVVPKLSDIFINMKEDLPFITKFIFMLSEGLRAQFLLLLFLLATSVVFFKNLNFQIIKRCSQWLFKSYIHQLINAQFARYLEITFKAGLPITQAVYLSAEACSNSLMKEIALAMNHNIQLGSPLSVTMKPFPLFPQTFIQMVAIGEESGTLDSMLEKIADWYESENEHHLHQLTQFIEPLIMILLGALIGCLVIGIYLPIFKLGSAI